MVGEEKTKMAVKRVAENEAGEGEDEEEFQRALEVAGTEGAGREGGGRNTG